MKRAARTTEIGPRHPLVQMVRRALARGELTPDGLCAIEGAHLIEEALKSRLHISAVLATSSAADRLRPLRRSLDGSAACYAVSERVFRSLAQTETPQGMAALVRLPARPLDDCLRQPAALGLVLVGVQDPGNLGTMLRSFEAFGGTACLLGPGTVSPYNAKAVRASAGSLFRVPVFPRLSPERILVLCRAHGLRTVGLAARAERSLSELDLTGPVAFFVGSEARGLPEELLAQLDARARIPLAAPVESLNAALAAGLALYETARQRGFRSR